MGIVKVIGDNIILAAKVSLENGQAKYRTYFFKYTWYKNYKTAVDAYLTANGYADCIVTE